MTIYRYSPEKNRKLIEEQGISFEEVIAAIENDQVIVEEHPKYGNQKIYVIRIIDYVYLVPFIDNGDEIFLKTIIPSRKAKKKYSEEGKNEKK